MPPQYLRVGPTLFEQFLRYMSAHSDVPLVNLRSVLRDAKSEGMLYTPYDTHWNPLGAYYGYRTIARQMDDGIIPPQAILDLHDLHYFEDRNIREDELGRMLGLPDMYTFFRARYIPAHPCAHQVNYAGPAAYSEDAPAVLMRCERDQPRALIFRDSFSNQLIPILSEHFSETLYISAYSYRVSNFAEIIDYFHPDVVIDETVERKLYDVPPLSARLDTET
jgi:alginate O-acetyltransferase complex protein AlgJ